MKIKRKILLIFIGILLSLVILEISLQIAGFTATTIKKYKNKVTKDSNTITILCLGESTTDRQWPPILQKILDEKSKNKKFNVIDEGIMGTDSKHIAKKIKYNLLKYNPDIIISMIGINDAGLGYQKSKIKIFNLMQLIFYHIISYCFYTDISFNEIDGDCMELIKREDISLARQKYYNLLKLSKFSDAYIYFILWELIRYNKQEEIDMKFYDSLLEHDEIFIMDSALEYILKYLSFYKYYSTEQIKTFLIKNKNRILYNPDTLLLTEILTKYDVLFLLNDIKNNCYVQNENKLLIKLLELKNKSANYLYIINKAFLINNKIIFIPMQYPILSIEQLKNDLKDSPYYNKLIFISNEENFKQALKSHKTEDIFVDRFAGDFGHCTEYGNTLIAENVAETLFKLY